MSNFVFKPGLMCLLTVLLLPVGLVAAEKNEVVVMGMIHSGHRRTGPYDISHLKQIIRQVKPDYVLTEIPPDRLDPTRPIRCRNKAVRRHGHDHRIPSPRLPGIH
ncbi:MAG: hypothetical protein AB8G99_22835 [Planctomycetaceae bacterium]